MSARRYFKPNPPSRGYCERCGHRFEIHHSENDRPITCCGHGCYCPAFVGPFEPAAVPVVETQEPAELRETPE